MRLHAAGRGASPEVEGGREGRGRSPLLQQGPVSSVLSVFFLRREMWLEMKSTRQLRLTRMCGGRSCNVEEGLSLTS